MANIVPVRIQRRRAKGARMTSPNGLPVVYVGRPGMFGNYAAARLGLPRTGQSAADAFRKWVETEASEAWKGHAAQTLRGKNLACWCAILDQQNNYTPCHADVLLSLANDIPIDEVIRENTRRAKGETL